MYINASLIRELRMIAQHALDRSSGPRLRPSPSKPAFKCAVCVRSRKKMFWQDAVTVSGGQALCEEHLV